MAVKENSPERKSRAITRPLLLIVGGVLILLWLVIPLIVTSVFPNLEEAAHFSTTFSTFNSLVSSLALLGAIVSIYIQHQDIESTKKDRVQKDRRDATFALFRDFHSEDMTIARTRAHRWLEERTSLGNGSTSFSDLSTDDPSRTALLRVCQFFFSMHGLCRHNVLDTELSENLFGFYLEWWKSYLREVRADFSGVCAGPGSQNYEPVVDAILEFSLSGNK